MSTAYDTAPHRPAPLRAAARQAAASDDSWLDSWEAGRDGGQPDSQDSVPGYFAPRIYRGRSVDELIPTIVAELGEDAVVIRHQRGLAGGFAGFFQKAFVEIEARRGDPGGSLLDRYDEDDAAPALPGDGPTMLPDDAAPAPPRDAYRELPGEGPTMLRGDTAPAPPRNAYRELPGERPTMLPDNAAPAPPRDAYRELPGERPTMLQGDTAPAPPRNAYRELPGERPTMLPDDTPPAPPRDAYRELPGEFDYARPPAAPKPINWDGATEVWATNPFAAALAEAEAAVRAAEPAVPPDLDAALAEALAEAEDAQAPEEIVAASSPDLYPEPPELPAEAALPAEPTAVSPTPLHPGSPADTAIEPEDETPSTRGGAREEIEHTLRAVGIGDELVRELIEAASTHVLPLLPPSTSLAQAVHTALTQMIPASRPLPAAGAAIAVVGAGGSGKSACCAALAEAYREHSTLPATCVAVAPDTTIDEPALREARARGLLLLDTPTVSSADPSSINALAELLEQLRPDRVVLALPATLGATPAAQLLEALGPLQADALAITHADETDQLGVAAQTACAFGLAPIHLLARAEHGAWALTWIDPFLLADRLLPPR